MTCSPTGERRMTGRTHRGIGVGLAALALAAVAAGCARGTDGTRVDRPAAPAGAAAAGGTPTDQLSRAVAAVAATSFTYQVRMPQQTAEGALDPAKKLGRVHSVISGGGEDVTADLLIVEGDYYVKLSSFRVPDTFIRVRAADVGSGQLFGVSLSSDPVGVT